MRAKKVMQLEKVNTPNKSIYFMRGKITETYGTLTLNPKKCKMMLRFIYIRTATRISCWQIGYFGKIGTFH